MIPTKLGRTTTLVTAVVTAVLVRGDAAADGQRRIQLSFNVLATAAGGPTYQTGGIALGLSAGEGSEPMYLALSASGTGPCTTSATASMAPPALAPGEVGWAVEARLREASLDKATAEIRWTRLGAPAAHVPTRANAEWQQVTLQTSDQRVLLDYVPSPIAQGECRLRNWALEFEMSHPGDAGLQDEVADYELWLVHDDRGRVTNSAPFRTSVRQGTAASFRFPAVQLEPPSGEGDNGGTDLVVEGEIRGWVRRDGGIDLVLSARRNLMVEGRSRMFAEAGRKVAMVASGEAVRFTLPDVTLRARAGERFAGALDGHAFSLVLVARARE